MKEIQVEGKTVPLAVDKALKDLAMRRDQVEVVVLNEGSSGFLGIGARKACVVVRERKWTGERKERRPRAFAKSKGSRTVPHPQTSARGGPAPNRHQERAVGHQEISGSHSPCRTRAVPHSGAAPTAKHVPQGTPQGGTPQETLRESAPVVTAPGQSLQAGQSFAEGGGQAPVETQPVVESAKSVVSQILNLFGIRFTELKAEWDSRQSRVCVEFACESGSIFAEKDARTLEALQFLVTLIVSRKNKTPVAVQVDTGNHWKRMEGEILEKVNRIVETVKNTGRPYRLDPMSPAVRRFVHKVLEASTDVETASEGESKWRKIVIKPRT